MDDISQQLKNEILSLESYIERTEDRLLATKWSSDLLDPLEPQGEELAEADLTMALTALQQAKAKFDVNGRVGARIDEILDKHSSLLPDPVEEMEAQEEDIVLSVDAEADSDAFPEMADSLFEEEEEEGDEIATDPALFEMGAPDSENGHETPDSGFAFAGLADEEEEDEEEEETESAALFEGFGDEEEEDRVVDNAPALSAGLSSDDLFADPAPLGKSATQEADSASEILRSSSDKEDRSRTAKDRPADADTGEIDIFAHKISLNDVQAAMNLSLQKDDLAQLQQRLRAKLGDKVMACLCKSKLAEKQFVLIPRIPRFVHKGASQPCTVLTLAKAFPALFGKIQELGRYRGSGFMTSETPEPGWALISLESPRESIGKSYMEQNHYLRYLATSLGIPSHMIRRRTLVEAVYDLLVCRMALNVTPQRQTLDWTSTSPARNDYICVYYAEEGLRVRDLTRTTRHDSLGVCPNW